MPTNKNQLKGELSSPLADRFLGLLMGNLQLPDDKTLEDHSTEGYRMYSTMLRKAAQRALCFRNRSYLTMAQGWNVAPGEGDPEDKRGLAAFVEEVFKAVKDFQTSRRRFFRAVAFGFQPVEIMFALRPDGKLGIERFAIIL